MKFLKIIYTLFLFYFICSKPIFASEDFLVNSFLEYKISEKGYASVTNTIEINNQKSVVFPKGYSLTFNKYAPINLKVYENGILLKTDFSQSEDNFRYLINFENLDVGLDTKKTFLVTYEISSFAKKMGDTWEVTIPYPDKLENYGIYRVSLIVPKSFGRDNFLSRTPASVKRNIETTNFVFAKDVKKLGNIYVSFGEFQTYDFDITYHLENPLDQKSYSEIAIVPDTNYQRVYYENISPKPEKIFRDIDGNWIAGFNFKPREKIDIKTTGFVQVFNNSMNTFSDYSDDYLAKIKAEDNFWETKDPFVINIANKLNTPRDIYNYLVLNMFYDETKISDFKFERLGAKRALESLNQSLCLEFTDSFIALARAKNIPAREINGYAVTDDKASKPLSLISDVLHAWPEYWDDGKKTWVSIDPTWGKTSGINYFDNFDMKHIVFAIHGVNSQTPYSAGTYKLGSDPLKDVLVTPKMLPPERKSDRVDITYKTISSFNPFSEYVEITVTNNGNTALYGVNALAKLGETQLDSTNYPYLLPFSSFTKMVKVPYKFLGVNMPSDITYTIQGNVTNIPIHKNTRIIIHILLVFSTISVVLTFVVHYTHNLQKEKHV